MQGAELDVIAGAKTALSRCEALIAELSLASYNKDAPLIGKTLPAITELGFRCVDICELHRADAGNVLQADFLFVKPALFAAIGKRQGLAGDCGNSDLVGAVSISGFAIIRTRRSERRPGRGARPLCSL